MSLRQAKLFDCWYTKRSLIDPTMTLAKGGSSYDEAIDIDKLPLREAPRDDTSDTENTSVMSSYGYCDVESVDGAAAHLPGIEINKCPRYDFKRVTFDTPKRPDNRTCPGFWYTQDTPSQYVGAENVENQQNKSAMDEDINGQDVNPVAKSEKESSEGETYNVRNMDKDLQAGMAEAEAKNQEEHKYAPKARNSLKTTRKPQSEYEVHVAPMAQRPRFPFGTEPRTKLTSTLTSSDKKELIDLNDFVIPSPDFNRNRPWPHLTQDSVDSPNETQNTSRTAEEKASAPEKKRLPTARRTPPLQKNLFADQYFDALKGQFQDIRDNSAALTERMKEMHKKMEHLVQQNHAHFNRTAGFRQDNKNTEKMVKEIGKKMQLSATELHFLKQRCSILEKLDQHMNKLDENMIKLQGQAREEFVDFIQESALQVSFDYEKLQDIMMNKIYPLLMEYLDGKHVAYLEAIKDIFHKCIHENWEFETSDRYKSELNAIYQSISELKGREGNVSDEVIFSVIEQTLERVLGTNRLHNLIKCAVAEKLAEVFRGNMIRKNMLEACREGNHHLMEEMEHMVEHIAQNIESQTRSRFDRLDGDLSIRLQNMQHEHEISLNHLNERMEEVAKQAEETLRNTKKELNEFGMRMDHNTKHFEVTLINANKGFKQVLKQCEHNNNVGNAEILSVLGDTTSAVNELAKSFNGKASLEKGSDEASSTLIGTVSELEAVVKSLDCHISDIKEEIKLIPRLHKTMNEIVYVMNSTMGEELIKEHDEDEDMVMKENQETNNKPVNVPKQRAARRQTATKGKKK
jgi:hypothetical protein